MPNTLNAKTLELPAKNYHHLVMSHWQHIHSHTFWHRHRYIFWLIVALWCLLLVSILPIPYYQSKDIYCVKAPCPTKGLAWHPSLIQQLGRNASFNKNKSTYIPQPTKVLEQHTELDTYTNKKFGFQVQYPQSFTLKGPAGDAPGEGGENQGLVIFESPVISFSWKVLRNENPQRLALNTKWINSYDKKTRGIGNQPESGTTESVKEVIIDGRNAVQKTITRGSFSYRSLLLYIPQDTNVLELYLTFPEYTESNQQQMDAFSTTFLSSFMFLPQQ
jgi:hypothetical protein